MNQSDQQSKPLLPPSTITPACSISAAHSGIGKTHLLMAAVNRTNHNHGRAYYAKT